MLAFEIIHARPLSGLSFGISSQDLQRTLLSAQAWHYTTPLRSSRHLHRIVKIGYVSETSTYK